ncbi:MAG: hypothetical protein HQL01_01400 [Nitrospirae bacterium]|nr:hypothetical protein [Nitrospirota bacterium]
MEQNISGTQSKETLIPAPPPTGRLISGIIVIALGSIAPLLIPLIVKSGLPAGIKVTVSGLLIFGIPELFTLAGAAILGKAGFAYVKNFLLGLLKRYAPPATVSRTRYRIGICMLSAIFVAATIEPYMGYFVTGLQRYRITYVICGDLLTLASLFVLGGDFWDKLRALFSYEAKVCLPAAGK